MSSTKKDSRKATRKRPAKKKRKRNRTSTTIKAVKVPAPQTKQLYRAKRIRRYIELVYEHEIGQ